MEKFRCISSISPGSSSAKIVLIMPTFQALLRPHFNIGEASRTEFSLMKSVVISILLFRAISIRAPMHFHWVAPHGFLQGQELTMNIVIWL